MFSKVPLNFRIILGIDKTDRSVFIFRCHRVGEEAETERERKRGRERVKERERDQAYIWGISWILTSQPPEMYQNGGIRVSRCVSHLPQDHRDNALRFDSELTSNFLIINAMFQVP